MHGIKIHKSRSEKRENILQGTFELTFIRRD